MSNKNKVFNLFSSKAKEQTENTEIKISIDIFYELFRLIMTQNIHKCLQSDIKKISTLAPEDLKKE